MHASISRILGATKTVVRDSDYLSGVGKIHDGVLIPCGSVGVYTCKHSLIYILNIYVLYCVHY